MGKTVKGSRTLEWNESQEHIASLKQRATEQFVNAWRRHRDRQESSEDSEKWGDEIEYTVLFVPVSEPSRCTLSLRGDDIRSTAQAVVDYLYVERTPVVAG